ncbi:MAG: hypothetical protein DRO13_02075 [Thermoprotei archaeon]|nr:MAG: hypothetical protein DRO13_02075 [Thermoprotei archaeon]
MKEKKRVREYLIRLFELLLSNREKYFYGDCVNSDGRKVLENILAAIVREAPIYRRRIYRIRRSPCYEDIYKLYEEVMKYYGLK